MKMRGGLHLAEIFFILLHLHFFNPKPTTMKNSNEEILSQRRSFLGRFAGAMGLSLFGIKGNASPTAPADDWIAKLTGKHKMVFDVTQPHGIFPFAWPRVFLLTNQATGTPENQLNAVIVLRHNGIPYAMQDSLWAKYKLGEAFGIDDHLTGKPALRNPFWQPKPGEFSIPGIGAVNIGINELQASSVTICVCDMAMTVNSYGMAKKINKDGAEIKKDWIAGLLPGVNIVPSGIWAIGRAQEQGSAYCFAS